MTDLSWTEDRITTLKTMWDGGSTVTEISMALNVSRSAVSGKIHRNGWQRQEPKEEKALKSRLARQRNKAAGISKPKNRPYLYGRKAKPAKREVEPVPVPAVVAAPPLMLSVLDIGPRQCRYGIGDPKQPGFGFCGHETKPGSSFCAGHHAMCWVPIRKRAG